jgi:deoxyribose-phosphate aldolase
MQWADLQRIIAEEVSTALARNRTRTCDCHAVLYDCCPDRVRGVIDAGASRLGLYAGGKVPADVASLIDHTLLKADATRQEIEKLCNEAREFGFATVCINPHWVLLAARLLRGSATRVCTVVGFPRVIYDGATEVDMVINVGALKSGDLGVVERDITAVVSACKDCGVLSKVIIEAALLTDEEKITACALSKAAGADYVKTSTGFGPGGATVADVELMRRVVGPDIGVKAAGGVRDYEALKSLVSAGASRVGASAGVKILQESKGAAQSSSSATGGVPQKSAY